MLLNKQAFTGEPIVETRTDTPAEAAAGVAGWAWRSWMPSAPWIPGSWYWSKIERALGEGTDPLGHDYSVPQALASSAGVKVAPQDVRYGLALHRRRLEATRAELMDRLRQVKRDYGRRLIGTERYLSELRGYERKMRALAGEAGEVLGGG